MTKTALSLFLLLHVFVFCSFGQEKPAIGIDCNPRLNAVEIHFMDSLFAKENFNFENKLIGFAMYKSYYHIDKRSYFNQENGCVSKLYVLNNTQKKISQGYDAIVLSVPQNEYGKMKKYNLDKLIKDFSRSGSNYPSNTDQVTGDVSPYLNDEQGVFFNQLYRSRRGTFDFTNKKIAFVYTRESFKKASVISKNQYISEVKKHLETKDSYCTDFLYVLNEDQKKASGGYDCIIQYMCKMDYSLNLLISVLNKSEMTEK